MTRPLFNIKCFIYPCVYIVIKYGNLFLMWLLCCKIQIHAICKSRKCWRAPWSYWVLGSNKKKNARQSKMKNWIFFRLINQPNSITVLNDSGLKQGFQSFSWLQHYTIFLKALLLRNISYEKAIQNYKVNQIADYGKQLRFRIISLIKHSQIFSIFSTLCLIKVIAKCLKILNFSQVSNFYTDILEIFWLQNLLGFLDFDLPSSCVSFQLCFKAIVSANILTDLTMGNGMKIFQIQVLNL